MNCNAEPEIILRLEGNKWFMTARCRECGKYSSLTVPKKAKVSAQCNLFVKTLKRLNEMWGKDHGECRDFLLILYNVFR